MLRFRVLGHYEAKFREEGRRAGAVWQCGERPKHVFFTDGQTGADRVWVDPDALEFMEQLFEAFRL